MMPSIQLNDLHLYYEQLGAGEPLVFLHSAYSRGILAFSCQLLDFQQRYACYLPDFRGHGHSQCPSLAWSTPQLAEDIHAMLAALGIPSAHIVGYSMGANVGLYLAARHPQRVRSLVAIGCSGVADPTGADEYEPEQLIQAGRQDFISRMIANHAGAHRGDWQEFLRQSAQDWRLYPQLSAEELSGIHCPAFFIAGERDPFTTEAQVQRLCELLPNARYRIIPGGTHRPHFLHEEPRLVNHEILEFLAAAPPA